MNGRGRRHVPAIPKSIVLVGLMGAGKTHVGRRLAMRLHLPFTDADQEIEAAAGCSIEHIFERHGEADFREGEQRVIARLLDGPTVQVLATGGGAFMNPDTRARIRERAISVWLRADIDLLLRRVSRRRGSRPLLKEANPREVLERLIAERYPIYAQADIVIDSVDGPGSITVDRVMAALTRFLADGRAEGSAPKEAVRS